MQTWISTILCLPESILSHIFSNWISITDLSALDCAICNRAERTLFLILASSLCLPGSLEWYCSARIRSIMCNLLMIWVLKRNIAVTELLWTKVFVMSRSTRRQYLQRNGKHITSVIYDYNESLGIDKNELCEVAVKDLCEYCKNVDNLQILRKPATRILEMMTSSWSKLKCCTIHQCDQDHLRIISKSSRALQKITLSESRISTSDWLHFFEACSPHLQEIRGAEPLSEEVRTALAVKFPNMRSFPIATAAMRDENLHSLIQDFPNLDRLAFNRSFLISQNSYITLARRGNLVQLRLSQLPTLLDATIEKIASLCPLLREIDIESTGVTGASLISIGNHCAQLEVLKFRWNRNIIHPCNESETSFCIATVAHGCPLLRELWIWKYLDSTGLKEIAFHCPLLGQIHIYECFIDDSSLSAVSIHCRQLKYFSMHKCQNAGLSDQGFDHIARNCKKLKKLRLFSEEGLTPNSIACFMKYSSSVRFIATNLLIREFCSGYDEKNIEFFQL